MDLNVTIPGAVKKAGERCGKIPLPELPLSKKVLNAFEQVIIPMVCAG
jgi:hypothetical protein